MLMKRKYQNKSAAEKKIRLWLEENNKTINDLAVILEVSTGTIHDWFKGRYTPSKPEMHKKLNELFGIENDWLN